MRLFRFGIEFLLGTIGVSCLFNVVPRARDRLSQFDFQCGRCRAGAYERDGTKAEESRMSGGVKNVFHRVYCFLFCLEMTKGIGFGIQGSGVSPRSAGRHEVSSGVSGRSGMGV